MPPGYYRRPARRGKLVLFQDVLRVVRVIVGEFGRHLELLARVQMEFNAEFMPLVIGAGQGEQVPRLKLLAGRLQFWRLVLREFSLCVDENLHRIASFFLVVEARQPRPAPYLLQN